MKTTLLLLCSLFLSAVCLAETIYVTVDGTAGASGTNWEESLDFNTALTKAVAGDEIWTAKGTYFLNEEAGRSATFAIPAGVKLLGGFTGTEEDMEERNHGIRSVLSGELGDPTKTSDNAYTVVTLLASEEDYTTFDGFSIEGGSGRNFKEGLTHGSSGGGMYIMASATMTDHLIVNCVFENNTAHNGGAVLVDTGRPSFIGCSFINNKADFNGGAVYNKGIASEASPIFRDCTFLNNSSNSGAGMTNNGSNGSSNPLILNSDFVDNVSLMNGAAIYNITDDNGKAEPIIENCIFEGNDSILGDDVSGMGVSRAVTAQARRAGGGNLSPATRR